MENIIQELIIIEEKAREALTEAYGEEAALEELIEQARQRLEVEAEREADERIRDIKASSDAETGRKVAEIAEAARAKVAEIAEAFEQRRVRLAEEAFRMVVDYD